MKTNCSKKEKRRLQTSCFTAFYRDNPLIGLSYLLLSFIFVFGSTSAQENQIALSDCIDMALENNPKLRVASIKVKSAHEEALQAQRALYPVLDMAGSLRRQSMVPEINLPPVRSPFGDGDVYLFPGGGLQLGDVDSYDLKVTLFQPVFSGFMLKNRWQVARLEVELSRYELAEEKNNLIYAVSLAFFNLLKAQRFSDIARTVFRQVEVHHRDVTHLYDQGMTRRDEVMKVKVRLSQSELDTMRAHHAIQLARASLENELGVTLPEAGRIVFQSSADITALSLPDAINDAGERRAALKTLSQMKRMAQVGERIIRGEALPSIGAFATFGYGKPGLDFIDDEWMDYWVVGVGMDWNLWDWGRRKSRLQDARLKTESVERMRLKVEMDIRLEVTGAYLRIEEANSFCALSAQVEQEALEVFRVTENNFHQGMATNSDYLDAQLELTRVRLQKAQAEIDREIALAQWRHAIGIE